MESKEEGQARGIAERLRSARESRGLSQSELSLRAGLNRKTCHDIESGKGTGNIGVLTLRKLADVMGLSAAYLAFGEDDQLLRFIKAGTSRLALGAYDEDEEEVEDEEEEEQEECSPVDESEVWPFGHRPLMGNYWELRSLGRQYAPVLEALALKLTPQRRKEVGHLMVATLLTLLDGREKRRECAQLLRSVLITVVPAPDHPVVDLVERQLQLDVITSGRMALSLILDGGLPVTFRQLKPAMSLEYPSGLQGPLDMVLEILEKLAGARLVPSDLGGDMPHLPEG